MKKILFLILTGLFLTNVQAQVLGKAGYVLVDDDGYFSSALYGNGIVDLLVQDSVVWVATGYGLSKATVSADGEVSWQSFDEDDYLGKGGISAMGLMPDDSTFWIATAFDTTAQGEDLPAGGGLSYTNDGGQTWTHVAQPVDDLEEENYSPTTTVIQNLTYDIAFVGETIWIASFGGGLRKSNDMGQTWQVVTTDSLFFSSAIHLNHRAFSLLNVNDTLWVGTAEGLSKTEDNGASWSRYRFSASDSTSISGEFIVALAYQQAENAVWAACLPGDADDSEFRSVCRTNDGGQTWHRMLNEDYLFPHNMAFYESRAYVATDLGMYYQNTPDGEWMSIAGVQDLNSGNEIFQEEYYSAAVMDDKLWMGNSDGLAYATITDDLGNADWNIVRSYVSTTERDDPQVYAYPSPFSPSRNYYIRFEFGDKILDEAIRIYDFAMNEVTKVEIDNLKPKWNGVNSAGDVVASGVYFFKAKLDGKVHWGKIVVIN